MKNRPKRRKFRQETVIHSYITRPLSIEIIRLIWNSGITPNQITIFRILLNVIALFLFAQGTFVSILFGFVLFQTHELLDSVDGMYARLKEHRSKIGVWMEQFFDAIFSDANGLLGLALSYGAYRVTGEMSYFILLILSLSSVHLFEIFLKVFDISKKKEGFEHKEYGNDYLQIVGVGWKTGMKNLYLTVLTWQNQILLFGLLLLIPFYEMFGIDIYLYAMVLFVLLNQPPWIYTGWMGYKKANEKI
ncbi:CDP-alcohol phosphatidyltransferase family protein [Nitratifractor sp.]